MSLIMVEKFAAVGANLEFGLVCSSRLFSSGNYTLFLGPIVILCLDSELICAIDIISSGAHCIWQASCGASFGSATSSATVPSA